MTEYMLGGSIFSQEKSNAYWYNIKLDTSFTPDADDTKDIIKHIQDCKKNPTIGLLARKQFESNYYPLFKKRNMDLLMRNPKIKAIKESFERVFKEELYPKTHQARKYLIDKKFIVLDYVKPRTKTLGKTLFKIFSR